jgi:hypothetical protein
MRTKNIASHSLVLLIILAFIYVTFGHQILFHNKTLSSIPGNPWLDNAVVDLWEAPTAKIVSSMLSDFELPLWNKSIGIGVPLFSDPVNSLFSPFKFIVYAFPNAFGWDIVTLLRLFLLIFFSYLLFFHLGINRWISVFAAILLGFSGHVFYFLNLVLMNSLVFTPLVLLGILAGCEKKYRLSLWSLSIGISLMILGGVFVDFLLTTIYGFFIILVYLIMNLFQRAGAKEYLTILKIGLYVLIGILISSIYLIPYLEARTVAIPLLQTGRSTAVFNSLWYFLGLFFNNLCVTPANKSHYYMNFRQYLHLICIPGFFFALISLFVKDQKYKYFIVGSLLFFLFYFFKLYDFKFIQFINNIPILQDIRFEKYQGNFNLTFYLLSAVGYNFAFNNRDKNIYRILFILLTLGTAALPYLYVYHYHLGKIIWKDYALLPLKILFFYLLFFIKDTKVIPTILKNIILLLIISFIVFSQISIDMKHTFANRRELYPDMKQISEEIKKKTSPNNRILPMTGRDPRVWSAFGLNDVRNACIICTKRYYNFFKNHIEHYTCWTVSILCYNRPDKINLRLAEFIGVKYLIINRSQIGALAQNDYKNYKISDSFSDKVIVELLNPTPLISLYDGLILSTPEEILTTITTGSYDLKKVYVEEPLLKMNPSEKQQEFSVSNVSWRNNAISAETESNKDSMLVLNSEFFPGWKAYVDNRRTPIFRANYLFQGIQLPSGKHLVEFRYRPDSLLIGSILSLIGIVAVFVLSHFIKKRHNH